MPGTYVDGYNAYASNFVMTNAQTDGFAVCPPSEFTSVPVTNVAYAQDQIAGPSSTTISTQKLTNTTANATGKLHLDLTDLICRSTAGKGVTVTSVTLVYTLTTAVLTAGPTVAVISQTFGAAGAAAAAPTAAATAGGTITSTPGSPPVAIPTAGQFYTVSYALGTPLILNNPLQRAYVEIGVPMTATGVFHLAGAMVQFTSNPL